MKLLLDRPHVEALVAELPGLASLGEQLRFGNVAEAELKQLERPAVDFLIGLYRRGTAESQLRAAQLTSLCGARDEPGKRFAADELEDIVPALLQYLLQDPQRGWLFSANLGLRPLPYVVTRIDFTPASSEETGKVFIELKANAKGATME